MSIWRIFRRDVLPATVEAESFYAIADPSNAGLADLIITGDPGHARKVKGVTNEAEVTAIAAATIAATPFTGIDLGTFN